MFNVLEKTKPAGLLKKFFQVLFQVIITNEVSVSILWAYIFISVFILVRRRVYKTDYLRHIYVQQLMASNFAKSGKNFKRELYLNFIILFSNYCLFYCRFVMFQKCFLNKPKWGAKRLLGGGGHGLPWHS